MYRTTNRRARRAGLSSILPIVAVLAGLVAIASFTTAAGAADEAAALTDRITGHLDRARALLDQVLAVQGQRTVANTLEPLNDLSIELDSAGSWSHLMENVHPDAGVRTAAEKASQEVSTFGTALSLNRGVYDALAAVDLSGADAVTRRMVERALRDYRRSGVDKDEATRKKIQALQDELVEIGQAFGRNIREDTRFILLDDVSQLEGLPPDYIERHQPDESGKIRITTDYPDYVPFITYAADGKARERLYREFNNRAFPANRDVLNRLVAKRYELARTLGYDNWADYVTEDKMSGSAETVAAFIEKLDGAAKDRAGRDYAMLLERKRRDDPGADAVAEWEKSYYAELVKSEQYDFDSQVLRAYYDYPAVQQGILDLTGKLFGVSFRKVEDAPVWDESVDCFEMIENGEVRGRFYFDMHPRAGKFNHAATFDIQAGVTGHQIPVAALVCNFPGGDGEGPALMEQDDVETFLHEFGHLLHGLFAGHQRWVDQAGIATEWDFVEAPAQLLEEWALNQKALATFARHYETGETIPGDLVDRLRAARNFGNGTFITQQNYYTAFALSIYDRPPEEVDLDAQVRDLQERYGSFAYVPDTHMYAAFGHLDGYSAMYYTYMWSLVIEKDLFSRFDQANLLDADLTTEYRRTVLDPGGTRDAADLVRDFLGRPYGFDAFREWLNRAS